MPVDDFTGAASTKDAGSRGKRDAGNAESADEPAAEPASDRDPVEEDEDDVSASAGPAADAGRLSAKDAGAGRDAGLAPSETASCETLTYASFGKTFVETYCTECHNAKTPTMGLGGIVLDSLPMIVKNKMYLKKDVAPRADGKLPKMPKGGNDQLTDEERTKFAAWIDCGPT
jgi:cytochrome c5